MKYMKIILIIACFVLIIGCSNQNPTDKKSDYVTYDIQVEDKVYLGEESAENEVLLAFDYACIWCKKWITEVLPQINDTLIVPGVVKYYAQPLSLLSEKSLYMANVDYVIKKELPSEYYDIQSMFAFDSENEGWGTVEYVQSALEKYGIDKSLLESDIVIPDNLAISRTFTRNYGVESVPTVFVNNMKVVDPFDLNEIKSLLK